MARPCIVVAGMGRCGTSLMMQMLDAGGVPCVGRWPAFETAASSMGSFDPSRFAAMRETAIKLIDPANLRVGDMPDHIVLWMDRDPTQQARSQAKFLGVPARRVARALESDLRKSRGRHRAAVGVPGGCPALSVAFERLITDPTAAVADVAFFLAAWRWEVDAAAMARQVRRRSPDCYPGFLEIDLLNSGKAA